jgi:hypothetical protein
MHNCDFDTFEGDYDTQDCDLHAQVFIQHAGCDIKINQL